MYCLKPQLLGFTRCLSGGDRYSHAVLLKMVNHTFIVQQLYHNNSCYSSKLLSKEYIVGKQYSTNNKLIIKVVEVVCVRGGRLPSVTYFLFSLLIFFLLCFLFPILLFALYCVSFHPKCIQDLLLLCMLFCWCNFL